MRLYEFDQLSSRPTWSEIEKFVNENCQPYLKENPTWKEYPLYRGISSYRFEDFAKVISPRKDRKPADTPPDVHNALVDAFNKAGFKANRNNSLFCSFDRNIAKFYNPEKIYQVIPVGNFDYTWSPTVDDLFEPDLLAHYKINNEPDLIKWIKHHFKTSDLSNAIGTSNEIAIRCDKALVLRDSYYGNKNAA